MNNTVSDAKASELKRLYKSNLVAKSLFDSLASRQNGATVTKARRAAQITGQDYRDMVRLLKELGEMGVGRFLAGRKGQETRIEWAFDVRSLGKVAAGGGSRLEEVPADAEIEEDEGAAETAAADETIPHVFQLRPDMKVEIALPEDLTDREADRLASWIKSLPFS